MGNIYCIYLFPKVRMYIDVIAEYIDETMRVATLYLEKQKSFTENTVYPYATLKDLDQNTF